MTDIPLSKFLENRSQTEVAQLLKLTQGAISQMVIGKRDVFIKPDDLGGFTYYEIKKPRRKKAA